MTNTVTEFDLIYRYFQQQVSVNPLAQTVATVDKSIGDDAAVIGFDNPCKWVTCVDTMVQGRHFNDDWAQVDALAFAIGFKSVAVNASDLAAMGATPHSLLLALALPEHLANEAWLSDFAKGLFHACQQFGMTLIGGDTTRSDKLIVSVTANGVMDKETTPIYRNGAKVGDKVYVSGTLGDAGYALTHAETEVGQQLSHRLHMPTPRLALGQALAQLGQASAMIDVSDGLVQDLAHICEQSNVAMRIDLERLPTSKPLQSVDLKERLHYQLTGGDDYEVAFTLPAHIDPLALMAMYINNTSVTCIGEVIDLAVKAAQVDDFDSEKIILSYQNKKVTKEEPYPFDTYPNLAGFQHF